MKNQAFTLAEVLITLAIIGVIAAISVPSLIQKTNSAELKTAYKKAFAVANQALDQALYDGKIKEQPAKHDTTGASLDNFNAFKSYFKVVKECYNNNNNECWDSTGELSMQSQPIATTPAFIDNSGVAWSLFSHNENIILIDTNGFKKPNWYGKDRWVIVPTDINNVRVAESASAPRLPDKFGLGVFGGNGVDYTSYDVNWCQHPPCLYTSWLSGKD